MRFCLAPFTVAPFTVVPFTVVPFTVVPFTVVIAIVVASCSDRPGTPSLPATDRAFVCVVPQGCGSFACEIDHCKQSCGSKSDCAPGFKCDHGPCIVASPCAPGYKGPGGTKFSDIYRDVIADTDESAGRCQNGLCHGGDGRTAAGLGIGATKDSAWLALTTHQTRAYVAPACSSKPEPACCSSADGCPVVVPGPSAAAQSSLLEVVRAVVLDGKREAPMPLLTKSLGNCVLPDDIVARIGVWLNNGAPND